MRKTKSSTSACPSIQTESSEPENDTEKKTLVFLSFPIVMLFNLIKAILFELFIVLKFVYNSSSRILNKPTTAASQQDVNLEAVKLDQENKGATEMDLLAQQKFHHKKAFEFISQALKIDETQNSGVYALRIIVFYGKDLYGSRNASMMSYASCAHVK